MRVIDGHGDGWTTRQPIRLLALGISTRSHLQNTCIQNLSAALEAEWSGRPPWSAINAWIRIANSSWLGEVWQLIKEEEYSAWYSEKVVKGTRLLYNVEGFVSVNGSYNHVVNVDRIERI